MLDRLRNFFALERNVAVLATTALIYMSAEGLWLQFIPKYFEALGTPIVLIGTLVSAYMGLVAVFHATGGFLSDIYGRKKMFVLATIVAVPALFFYIGAQGWWYFLLPAMVLMAMTTGITETTDSIMVTESLKKNKRATGRATIHVFMASIAMVSAPIGGYIIQSLGIVRGVEVSMYVNMVTAVAAALIAMFFLKETLRKRKSKPRISLHPKLPVKFFMSLPIQVKRLILCRIFSLLAWSIAFPFFVFYALDVIGITPLQVGILFGIQAVSFAAFTMMGAKISDKYGRKYTILGLFASAALVPFLFTVSTSFAQLVPVSILWGMIGFGLSSIDAYTADHTPMRIRGKSIGIADTIYTASMIPGPIIGGILFVLLPQAPFWLSGAIGIVSVFLGLRLLR